LIAALLLITAGFSGWMAFDGLTSPNQVVAPVAPKVHTTPIQDIPVGHRVLGENPELTPADRAEFGPEPDPETWRKLELLARKVDGSTADVTLLRPVDWLEAQNAQVGGTVEINVPECGIEGAAEVLSIGPCPEIAEGPGQVVTGTFRHHSAAIVDVHVAGQSEPIGATANHPFWSEDRQTFLRADELQPGETLRTLTGPAQVIQAVPHPTPEPVYNLEVHGEHVYLVTADGVLVHNGADECFVTLYKAPQGHYDVGELVDRGLRSKTDGGNFGLHGAFFSTDPKVAHKYAKEYQNGVVEIQMPRDEFDRLVAEGKIVADTMEDSSVSILPDAFDEVNTISTRSYYDQLSETFYRLFGVP
jgi:hypothetical protein